MLFYSVATDHSSYFSQTSFAVNSDFGIFVAFLYNLNKFLNQLLRRSGELSIRKGIIFYSIFL